ncbi:hypothetical protein [Prolixibacter denitrificans]|uniref:Uncharacterized protein n=1 Tax=Prolixibacter denitrificans TaxID=1541063 RepID=A0A2P8CKZ9_9BACT|nr:hypothetical protein [Prolixibacter denitrificans]PSK85658.1 hypothetical protein CLV93_101624 [Prolixibacter denitrificans]
MARLTMGNTFMDQMRQDLKKSSWGITIILVVLLIALTILVNILF